MTKAMERAFAEAIVLPEAEQDRIASLIVEHLPGDRRWAELFADPRTPELLERLANQARAEIARGETYPLDDIL